VISYSVLKFGFTIFGWITVLSVLENDVDCVLKIKTSDTGLTTMKFVIRLLKFLLPSIIHYKHYLLALQKTKIQWQQNTN